MTAKNLIDSILSEVDGPAMVYPSGTQSWYIHGKLHRIGGPAIETDKGNKAYFVDGRRFTEAEYYRYVDQDTGEVLVPSGKKLAYEREQVVNL